MEFQLDESLHNNNLVDYNSELFRSMMKESVNKFSRLNVDEEILKDFVQHIDYFKGDISDLDAYQKLKKELLNTSKYPKNNQPIFCRVFDFSYEEFSLTYINTQKIM